MSKFILICLLDLTLHQKNEPTSNFHNNTLKKYSGFKKVMERKLFYFSGKILTILSS